MLDSGQGLEGEARWRGFGLGLGGQEAGVCGTFLFIIEWLLISIMGWMATGCKILMVVVMLRIDAASSTAYNFGNEIEHDYMGVLSSRIASW